MTGQTILHYKIKEKLGEGGMGEVYKAQDTKLDRFVALKFLPSQLNASEDDKARFIQEAKAASAMNHPNVCTIYSIEEYSGQLFIAMEYIEGKTLKDKKDSLSEKQILEIGIQAAEGLAAAHEKGIVHRDIKPENIMIRKDGIVQIMDFGLAKLRETSGVSRLTKAGMTMGTMGYMSPEQVQGLDVDHRTDIFSLGVVLYELLAGESPFKGMHETAIMYEIVNVEASPLSSIKEGFDPELDDIILECLEKDKDERCQSAKELAKDLRKIKKSTGHRKSRVYKVNQNSFIAKSGAVTNATPSGSLTVEVMNRKIDVTKFIRSRIIPWVFSILLLAALIATWLVLNKPAREKIVTKFSLEIENDNMLDVSSYPALAISHDGKSLVYKANSKFYIRKMNSTEPVLINGIENASSPFFSPDDDWLGFFANGKLEKISISGGTPVILADALDNRGGTWNDNGSIVFSATTTVGLSLISENGGTVKMITTIDSSKNERTHRWPSFLPDGEHVLFTVGTISSPDYYENAVIDVADIKSGERKTLIRGASTARYINSGHLLFSRSGVLYIVPFDANNLEIEGQPVPVIEGVYSELTTGITNYMVSDNGTLAYIPGAVEGGSRKIVKIDLNGNTTTLDSSGHPYLEPRLSPDNKKIALVIRDGEDFDIWIFDILRKTLSRLTFGGLNRTPQWSQNGKKIAFMKRTKDGKIGIFIKPYDGSGDEVEIYSGASRLYVDEWTTDGDNLIVDNLTLGAQSDLLVVPLKGNKKPWKYLDSKYDEYEASISPNGKWLAYLTNESGSYQGYVRSFPNKEGKWQISTDVIEEPRWSPDGKTLYYRKGSQLIAVPVTTSPTYSAGIPKVLISGFPSMNVDSGISYDITSDGKYFITTTPVKGSTLKNISIVLNWTEEIAALTKANK
ncbi:protein kinase [bacterium BMS3Abin03]|nr:protein kinase [bacterium BMS3Abin03]MCG6961601.1 protein kinase [bacterium BMS3Abin03]